MAAVRVTYNKLVRDKVPEAIERDGHTCLVEVLLPHDYVGALKRKLVEEAREALGATTQDELIQELANLTEVIAALIAVSDISPEALESSRLERRARRGGFEGRLLLHYVDRVEESRSE